MPVLTELRSKDYLRGQLWERQKTKRKELWVLFRIEQEYLPYFIENAFEGYGAGIKILNYPLNFDFVPEANDLGIKVEPGPVVLAPDVLTYFNQYLEYLFVPTITKVRITPFEDYMRINGAQGLQIPWRAKELYRRFTPGQYSYVTNTVTIGTVVGFKLEDLRSAAAEAGVVESELSIEFSYDLSYFVSPRFAAARTTGTSVLNFISMQLADDFVETEDEDSKYLSRVTTKLYATKELVQHSYTWSQYLHETPYFQTYDSTRTAESTTFTIDLLNPTESSFASFTSNPPIATFPPVLTFAPELGQYVQLGTVISGPNDLDPPPL